MQSLIEPRLFVGLVFGLPCRIRQTSLLKLVKNRRNHALHDHVDDASGDPTIPVIVNKIADTRASDLWAISRMNGLNDVCGHERNCTLKALLWRARRILNTAIEEDILLRSLTFHSADGSTKAVAPVAVGQRIRTMSRVVVNLIAIIDTEESCALNARFIPNMTIIGILKHIKQHFRGDVCEESVAEQLQAKHIRITCLLHVNFARIGRLAKFPSLSFVNDSFHLIKLFL